MRLLFVFLALLFVSSACGTQLSFIPTARPPRPLRALNTAQVKVYMTGKPDRPYTEVGIIESQQESLYSEDGAPDIIEQMRAYAASLGCDALAIFNDNNATVVSGGKDWTMSRTLLGYRGSCIVYTEQKPHAEAALTGIPMCVPNSTLICYGTGACRGAQRCEADGKSYTLCDCRKHVDVPSDTVGSVF